MKKFTVVFIIFVFAAFGLRAQYIPNNGQTFQFMPLFNPSFSGVERYDDLKFGYRYQWSGFGSYSPRFLNLSFNKRLVEPPDLAYNGLRVSKPSALGEEHLPRPKRMIHAVGADLFQSQVGVLQSVGGDIHYSLHYPVSRGTRFAMGVALVLENRKLDVAEVTVRDPDPFYNHLLSGSTSQTDMNLRAGVLLYSDKYYFGASYFPLVYRAIRSSDLAMTEPFYRGSVQAGFTVPLSADVTLKPGILALMQMNGDVAVDYNVKAFFKQNIWLGMTYRDIKSGIAIIGWNFNERLGASYSYEMSLGEFKQFNDGSHELVLSLRLHNTRKYSQYTW